MAHRPFSRCLVAGVLFALVVAGSGCRGARNKIVPVEGKLHFLDGKTLPAGTRLIFNPVEGGTGTAMGVTGEDGSFRLTHANGARGAEVGKYIVLLRAPETDQGAFYRMIPKDYYDGGILNAEVKEGMAALDFKVIRGKVAR